jgi:hypothetical protein
MIPEGTKLIQCLDLDRVYPYSGLNDCDTIGENIFSSFYGRLPLDGEGASHISTTSFVKMKFSKLTIEILMQKLYIRFSVRQETL